MVKRILFIVIPLLLTRQFVLAQDTWIEKRDGGLLVLHGHGVGTK
jgi:hypothetical protein